MKFLAMFLFVAVAVAAAFPTPEEEEVRRDKRSGLLVAGVGVAPAATVAVHAAPWVAAAHVVPPVISTTVVGAHPVVVPHVLSHVVVV